MLSNCNNWRTGHKSPAVLFLFGAVGAWEPSLVLSASFHDFARVHLQSNLPVVAIMSSCSHKILIRPGESVHFSGEVTTGTYPKLSYYFTSTSSPVLLYFTRFDAYPSSLSLLFLFYC
jgi:hypothetical protein